MNNLLDLLTRLIPLAGTFVPGAEEASQIAGTVAVIIKHLKEQSGKTTEQILDDADATLDETEKLLLADKVRLGG